MALPSTSRSLYCRPITTSKSRALVNRPSPVKPDNFFLMLFNLLRRRRVPLVLRIVSHTLLLVVLALLVHAWVMGLQFKHAMQQHADALGQSLITQTAASATELLVANDILSLSVLLNNLVENPLVAHATIHSVDNRVLAEAGAAPRRSLLEDNPGLYSAPIAFQEVIAGRLTIRLDMEQFKQPMTISLQNMALLSLILLALTLSLSLRLGRRISLPLMQLRVWLRDPDFPAPGAARQDEIGDLARQIQARLFDAEELAAREATAQAADEDTDDDGFESLLIDDQPRPAASVLGDPPIITANPGFSATQDDDDTAAASAVLAVQLGTAEQLRALDRHLQLDLQQCLRETVEQTARLYHAELHPLREGSSLIVFHQQTAEPNHLGQAACCGELLLAQLSALLQRTGGLPVSLQLGLADGPPLQGQSIGELLLSEQAQSALSLAQHSRNLLLLEAELAESAQMEPHARLRPVARPEGAYCVERLLPPYPALVERQLAKLLSARQDA